MLEQLRQNSRSFIIWVLFGIIIATFVFTFGTQSEVTPSCAGAATGSDVMTVDAEEVTVHSLRFGLSAFRGGGNEAARMRRVLDALLQREILAQAANDMGIRVGVDIISERIKNGDILIMGAPIDGKTLYYRNGYFDYKVLEAQVNALGLPSVEHFIQEQTREVTAQMVRELLQRSSLAAPEEAQSRYIHENTRVTLDVLQFRASEYRRGLSLAQADIEAYLAQHQTEVQEKYDGDKTLYQGVGKQLKLRQLMLERKKPATITPGSTDSTSGDSSAGEEDPGLVAAKAAKARIDGGEDFAAVAAEVNEDARSKNKGGDLGWRSATAPALGFRELASALENLEVGQVSDIIETPRGFYLLKVEDSREGDLSFDQVKYEIAERMAVDYYTAAAAERDAKMALAKVQGAAGKGLRDFYEAQQTPPRPGGNDLNVPPEQLQEILRQLQEQGSVIVEGDERPAKASWQEAGKPTGITGDQPAAAGASAAGAGANSDSGAATENIPVPTDLVTPKVQRLGPFNRDPDGTIFGLGASKELTKAAFDELSVGQLAGQIYEIGDAFIVAQLISRQDPNLEEYKEEEDKLVRDLALERGFRSFSTWLELRCKSMVDGSRINVNFSLMEQMVGGENQPPFVYTPNCSPI